MSDLYLIHHGIENQKWGVRNGPPYPLKAEAHSAAEKKAGTDGWANKGKTKGRIAGKAAAKGISAAGNIGSKIISNKANKSEKLSDDSKKKINSSAEKMNNSSQRISKSVNELTKKQVDLSNLSDNELRQIINRMQMEKQYHEMTDTTNIKSGKDYAMSLLDVSGDILAVGLTAFQLYKIIKGK